jgi:hypothetical protein
VRSAVSAPSGAAWLAAALTTLSLGLPWNLLQRGYQVETRVLVAAAAAALWFAAAGWTRRPVRTRGLVEAAVVLLVAALALALRGIHPSALITVLAAVGAAAVAHRRLAVRPT